MVGSKSWTSDSSIPPVDFRDNIDWLKRDNGQRKLKIGATWNDGIITPHPPVRRALQETMNILRGHDDIEIVEWNPFNHEPEFQIWSNLFLYHSPTRKLTDLQSHLLFADNGEAMMGLLRDSGEELRPLTKWIFVDNPLVAKRSLHGVWEWTSKRDIYRAEHAKVWNNTGRGDDFPVDVLLSPVFPGAASPLDKSKYWNYTLIWNILDYPSLAFPVTKVTPETDLKDSDFEPRNEQDLANHELYAPEIYQDAPVSLQLIGRRFEDEKLMQAMRFVKERLDAA